MFMSWNPGSCCRLLVPVIEAIGYHVVCLQEAWRAKLENIDIDRWSWSCECEQFVAARRPSNVEFHHGENIKGQTKWAVFTVWFGEPRVGRERFGVLSLHLNNNQAKKKVAGPEELKRVMEEAARSCSIDIVCGDINMARWNPCHDWNDRTLDVIEEAHFVPIADYVDECCFIAIKDTLAEEHPRSI